MRAIILATAFLAVASPAIAGNNENFDGAGPSYSGGGGRSVDLYEWVFTDKYKVQKDKSNAALLEIMRSGGLRSAWSSDPGGAPNHGPCNCGR